MYGEGLLLAGDPSLSGETDVESGDDFACGLEALPLRRIAWDMVEVDDGLGKIAVVELLL